VQQVRAKKHLGQHFLKDEAIAERIVNSLTQHTGYKKVLEVGPGMGILTDILFARSAYQTKVIDLDSESVKFLKSKHPFRHDDIIEGDFLRIDLAKIFEEPFAIIGNFPYNISTQILFSVLDHRQIIPEVVGMFQKEVAERIASGPGGREYGILSVLMQAFYDVKLLIFLNENDFDPPPKVKSAVLHFIRKENFELGCDPDKFKRVIKTAFNQRRKTLRNALSPLLSKDRMKEIPFLELRAETLSWEKFVELTLAIEAGGKGSAAS
jgi:16S rRNA (adenine1518-N6/adenine1519-N6)-dimethyltransferase